MAAKKSKKPKFVWPKRKKNKDLLKIKDKLSNEDVIKRLTLDKDEKKTFNEFKTASKLSGRKTASIFFIEPPLLPEHRLSHGTL